MAPPRDRERRCVHLVNSAGRTNINVLKTSHFKTVCPTYACTTPRVCVPDTHFFTYLYHTPNTRTLPGAKGCSGLVLLFPSLGSRPGAEEPVPQREALRKVDVGPYVVALVVRRAQLHLQGLEAVSVRDFGPG